MGARVIPTLFSMSRFSFNSAEDSLDVVIPEVGGFRHGCKAAATVAMTAI
jgi:hypothetical protein